MVLLTYPKLSTLLATGHRARKFKDGWAAFDNRQVSP
jgi:hypothetical protein